MHVRQGVVSVGIGFDEAEIAVDAAGRLHGVERVKHHAAMSDAAGFCDDAFSKLAPDMESAKRWPDVEAFHLARTGGDLAECDASGRLAVGECENDAAGWRSVSSGQGSEFVVELLKAQVDSDGLLVFEEQLADQRHVVRRLGKTKSNHPTTSVTAACSILISLHRLRVIDKAVPLESRRGGQNAQPCPDHQSGLERGNRREKRKPPCRKARAEHDRVASSSRYVPTGAVELVT